MDDGGCGNEAGADGLSGVVALGAEVGVAGVAFIWLNASDALGKLGAGAVFILRDSRFGCAPGACEAAKTYKTVNINKTSLPN